MACVAARGSCLEKKRRVQSRSGFHRVHVWRVDRWRDDWLILLSQHIATPVPIGLMQTSARICHVTNIYLLGMCWQEWLHVSMLVEGFTVRVARVLCIDGSEVLNQLSSIFGPVAAFSSAFGA